MKKRWLKLILALFAAAVAILLLGLGLIHTPPARHFILESVRARLLRESGIDVRAGGFRFNLFAATVTLEDITVRSAAAPSLPPLFQAESIYLKPDVFSIIRGSWDFREIRIAAPKIHCFIDRDGSSNLPKTKSAAGRAPEFLIGSAEAGNGWFQFEDLRKPFRLTLPRWQLRVTGNRRTRENEIHLATLNPAAFHYQTQSLPIEQARLSGILRGNVFRAGALDLRAADSDLSLTGTVRGFSRPGIDLLIKTELDLGKISRILNPHKKLEGRLTGTVRLGGAPDNLRITAWLKGKDIKALTYANANFDLNCRADWSNGRLKVHHAAIDSPDGFISGKAELFTGSMRGVNSVETELRRLNLSPVWKMLRPPFSLAGRATGAISLTWDGEFDPLRLSGRARLNLDATRKSPGPKALPIAGKLAAQLHPGRTIVHVEHLSLLGAALQGKFSLSSFREMDGELEGDAADIGGLMADISSFLGGSSHPAGDTQISGPLQFNARVSGEIGKPVVSVASYAPELQAGPFKRLGARAEAKIVGSQISFRGTAAMPEDAAIHAQGSLDMGGAEPILELDARGERIPAAAVAKMFDSTLPAAGTLNAQLHLSGRASDLAGSASVNGEDLSLYNVPLGSLDAGFRLNGNEIRSTRCTLLRDPGNPASDRVEAEFAYALDSGGFRFQAAGRDLRLKKITPSNEIPFQGTWNLTASGSGTIEHPSIDMRAESGDFQVQKRPLGPITLTATLRNRDLNLDASFSKLQVHSTALVTVETPYPFNGELHIANHDLASLGFKAADAQTLAGDIEAAVAGSGNLKDFARSNFSAQIKRLHLIAGGLELHTQEPFRADYRDNMLEIPAATIVSGNSRLAISGRVPLRQPATASSLRLKGQIDLAQAAGFAALPKGFVASGTVNLDLDLSGTLQKPGGSGTISLNGGILHLPGLQTPLTGIALRADVRDGSIILQQADASWDEGRIAIKGEFPFGLLPKGLPVEISRKEGPAVFSLDIKNLKPESSAKLPPGIGGLISLRAEGTAARADLRSLDARIDFRDLRVRANEIALEQTQPSVIVLRDGIASISRLSFSGADTNLTLSGSAGILRGAPVDLQLAGDLNAALLTFMSRDLKASGRLTVRAGITGDIKAPQLAGSAEMKGGKLTLRNPRVVADSLTVRLALDPKQVTVQEFRGTLNGGPLEVTGTIGYLDGILNGVDLAAKLQDFFFNLPEGLKSSSSGTLTIKSSEDAIVIGGNIRVQESSYRESFEVTGQLMSYLKEQQAVLEDRSADPLLDRIRLNIALRTETPLLVQNNIVRVGARANVRLVGSIKEPSMVGRITLEDGGEISVNRQTYYINRGMITLANQTRIEPEIDIQAQTTVGNYDITLQMTGSLERLTTTLSSEPALSQADISALLLTGKTTSEAQGREIQAARTQALALIAGQAGEELTDEVRRALHLSTLRIDPGLIASESDPGARLTLGQDITRRLSLVYSMNLTNGGDQIWSAEYEIVRGLRTQATKQQDNSYRFEFNHSLLFGRSSENRRSRAPSKGFVIGEIRFDGEAPFSDKALLDHFKIESGKKYDFQKVQKGLDRLNDFYAGQDRLEANVRLHRETLKNTVNLNLSIDSGPAVNFSVEGTSLPGKVREEVRNAWRNGAFDIERIDDSVRAIRQPLLGAGYLQAEVAHSIETDNDSKTVRFMITPGTRYVNVPLVFIGASAISAAQLNEAVAQANLGLDVYANPQKVAGYLNRFYWERGYLQASVSAPSYRLDPATGTGATTIQVREGPLFKIGDLEFSGNRAFGYDELWSAIPTSSGSSYDPNTLQDAVKSLEILYQRKGYNDVSVTFRIVLDAERSKANLTFYIAERRQSLIRDIAIEGNRDTSADFVGRQLAFAKGEPLDFARINETRRRLYSSGVYSTVDFQTEEIPAEKPDSNLKDVRVTVRVREVRPYRLQYGFFYDTDRGPGGILEAENRNVLGRALDLGLRIRYDSDLKEGRLYFYQPFVTKIHFKTDASAFFQRETRSAFSANRIGFSLFREQNLPRSFRLDYGYRYDHVRWNGLPPDPTIFQASVPVARLITTLSRDTRDSILDATRGEFSSHSLEFGPRFLGSEVGFTRYYGQYFRYVPLDKFLLRPKDKEKKAASKKIVYAGALRLGLTKAFGSGSVISPERFFAGGGTTMRGFEQDILGPTETLQDGTVRPFGGEALFLFNNEIRFPIFGILHGVGFVDIGNVYPRISDFDFTMRKSAGAGLRVKIKFIPLRFDYGLKLDRRPGESRGAFFFSIGQAF